MTSESRQVARQIRLFLEDGKRERLIVALALLDNRGDEGTAMSEKVHRFGLTWDSQEEYQAAVAELGEALARIDEAEHRSYCNWCGVQEREADR